ncbi:MAG: general secretion pathway protein GspI [Gammaproteobacteria bacterium]|nr:general secretion pathway protein GspI [Gammaproteobacteria bacterium]
MRAAGFSLLETLVAFSIAALALGVIFQIYARGTASVVQAGDYARAVAIAESRMTELSAADAPGIAASGVAAERYLWTIETGPYQDGAPAELDSLLRLRRVDVEVRWEDRGKARSFRLSTLKPESGGPGAE